MREKVVMTIRQAKEIQRGIKIYGKSRIMNDHEADGWVGNLVNLNGITKDEMARALYIGYEVEETFKVDDWVTSVSGATCQITKIRGEEVWGQWNRLTVTENYIKKVNVRHATPEEISKEKQRRWWARHGREVWELKVNDEIRHKESDRRFDIVHIFDNGDINMERTSTNDYKQKEVVTVKRSYISNYYYEVVCFAEDRKDVKE